MNEEEGYDPKCFHTCPDCDYRCNCGDIPCSHCLNYENEYIQEEWEAEQADWERRCKELKK